MDKNGRILKSNPFSTTFGRIPDVFIGRQAELGIFSENFSNDKNNNNRVLVIAGDRGAGKTSLLQKSTLMSSYNTSNIEWFSISLSGTSDGLLDTFKENLTYIVNSKFVGKIKNIDRKTSSHSLNIGIYKGEISFDSNNVTYNSLVLQLKDFYSKNHDFISNKKIGLYVNIDEISVKSIKEVSEIVLAVQHIIREDQNPIILSLAGTSKNINELLEERNVTFLNRAKKIHLTNIPIPIVSKEYISTFKNGGFKITDSQGEQLATLSNGNPYLIQLLGFNTWNVSIDNNKEVSSEIINYCYENVIDDFVNGLYMPDIKGIQIIIMKRL